jgi:hypothetical protein
MFHTHWHPPSLQDAVKQLEDGIIVLSGPALAISGIIAGIDLVTGGNILKSISWLTLAWAVTLLLTLDFQVLAFGVRAHRISRAAQKGGVRKCFEILLIVLIAAGISFVSIQMQSIIARSQAIITVIDRSGHEVTRPISIDEATTQLGINPIALIWERSTLVLVLIFMSGWLREDDSQKDELSAPAPAPALDMDALMAGVTQRLQAVYEPQLKAVYEQVQRVTIQLEQLPARPAHPDLLALPSQGASEAEQGVAPRLENRVPICEVPGEHPIYAERFESKEQVIAAILNRTPDATPEQVAAEAGCTVRTAEKWMHKLQPGA